MMKSAEIPTSPPANVLGNSPKAVEGEFKLFFPQVVAVAALGVPEMERKRYASHIRERKSDFKKQKRDNVAFEESSMDFHNNPEFEILFERIGSFVKNALSNMGFKASYLNFHVLRSWANYNSKGMITSMHSHLNSHVSIVYYPDSSCQSATIYFHGGSEHCWVPGLNSNQYAQISVYDNSNPFSATSYSFKPEEDLCLIFPSPLPHSVAPNSADQPRISIAMDGMFSLKKYERDEPLLPPPDTWKNIMS